MENWITVESFGSDCPENWEEIAAFLNEIIRERGIEDDHAAVNDLWEDYCNGDIPGAPNAIEEDTKIKHWILIETTGDQFETILNATTKEEAIKEANAIWNKLSKYDQKRLNEFFIIYAEMNDGIVDFDTATESINLLK